MKANWGILLFWAVGTGCGVGRGGLGIEAKAVTTQKPGLVAAYLSVTEGDGAAVGLRAADFTVYENGLALSRDATRQVLLDKGEAAAHHTLVLVDDSEATSPDVRRQLVEAINVFVPLVQATQSVSVFAFDGAATLRPVAEFARHGKISEAPVMTATVQAPTPRSEALSRDVALRPADTSRNLNGAILLAEKELTRRLGRTGKSLSTGSLVVFSAGPDLAGRASAADVESALRDSPHVVLGISFGAGRAELARFAKDGYIDGFEGSVLSLSFEEAAHRVRSLYDREYLLSYCSPARGGERTLRIEAHVLADDGREKSGAVSSRFEADGFGGSCDPTASPRFAKTVLAPKR